MTMCVYCGDRVGIVCDSCASTAKERDEARAEVEQLKEAWESAELRADDGWREVERLRKDLSEAVRYLRAAKKQFAPNTTNSLVDDFLAKIDARSVG